MAEDVADLAPRVRRAIEGPKSPLASSDPDYLTDDQVVALSADAIADIILLTEGRWGHVLARTGSPGNESWTIDPLLSEPEERVVALQVAVSYFFFIFQNAKTSELIANEGQQWEWTRSAQALVRQIDAVKEARDLALAALVAEVPVLAKYASFIAARDQLAAPLLEPWRTASGDSGAPGGVLYQYLL